MTKHPVCGHGTALPRRSFLTAAPAAAACAVVPVDAAPEIQTFAEGYEKGRADIIAYMKVFIGIEAEDVEPVANHANRRDQHPVWWAELRNVEAAWLEVSEDSDEHDRLWARRSYLSSCICQTPARTIEGLATQLTFLVHDAEHEQDWVLDDHRALALSAKTTAQRLLLQSGR